MQAEIRDITHLYSATFTWSWLDPEAEDGSVAMTLRYRDDFRVTTTVGDHRIGPPLVRFLEEVGSSSGDWNGAREYWNEDVHYGAKNFGITCYRCRQGKIYTEIALDADVIEPCWTIQLRMDVDQSAWPGIVKQFHDFFAVAKDWSK